MDTLGERFKGSWAAIAALLWGVLYVAGQITPFGGEALMSNDRCFRYLGCNVGYFGYDALEHLLIGAVFVCVVLWLFGRYGHLNLVPESGLHMTIVMLGLSALFAFFWEYLEYVGDIVRLFDLHQHILHPNFLWQASDADTMGDMTATIIGTLLSVWAWLAWRAWRKRGSR